MFWCGCFSLMKRKKNDMKNNKWRTTFHFLSVHVATMRVGRHFIFWNLLLKLFKIEMKRNKNEYATKEKLICQVENGYSCQ